MLQTESKIFYIGFSRNRYNKLGSKALQWYMGREYSHTFIEYDTSKNIDDNTIFHSSMSTGVSYWSNLNFEKSNIKTHLYKIEVSNELFFQLRKKTHIHAGDHYGYLQNIGIVIVDFFKNLGINIENPFRTNENCSELVFLFLVEMYPELKEKYNKDTIRPDHIQEILEDKGYKNILEEM